MAIDIEKLKNRTPGLLGNRKHFDASVCIPLIKTDAGYNILFEVRSMTLPDQPGDICLPGGGIEAGETPADAAARELCEELLVVPEQFEIIAEGDIFHSENTTVYSFIGLLKDYKGTFDSFETEEVFQVPVEFFLETDPVIYDMTFVPTCPDDFPYDKIVGGKNYQWRKRSADELFYDFEGRNIWGLTARIIKGFADVVKKEGCTE